MQPNGQGAISQNNLRNEGHRLYFFYKMIVLHCIYVIVKLLNAVSAKIGISEKFAPAETILSRKLDAKKDLRVRFGIYIKASCDAIITNDISNRTYPCISLGP